MSKDKSLGWYWSDNEGESWNGPKVTKERARLDAVAWLENHSARPEEYEDVTVAKMRKVPLRYDVFDAEQVLDALYEKNEEADWHGNPAGDHVTQKMAKVLEAVLTVAFIAWGLEYDLVGKFHGLEDAE